MKKHTLILIPIASVFLAGASVYSQSPTPSPSATISKYGGGCKNASWNPEVYSFYGAKDTIVQKLANISTQLSERRIFLQVTQGESSADVKLYERREDGTFTVTEWTPDQTSQLLTDIDQAIIANKGVNCVGEQVKSILANKLKGKKVVRATSAPASPEAAFAHSVNDASGKFIRTTITILC